MRHVIYGSFKLRPMLQSGQVQCWHVVHSTDPIYRTEEHPYICSIKSALHPHMGTRPLPACRHEIAWKQRQAMRCPEKHKGKNHVTRRSKLAYDNQQQL
jgi:hypothetical protein